jgi:hypothetical protein
LAYMNGKCRVLEVHICPGPNPAKNFELKIFLPILVGKTSTQAFNDLVTITSITGST